MSNDIDILIPRPSVADVVNQLMSSVSHPLPTEHDLRLLVAAAVLAGYNLCLSRAEKLASEKT
jgi:hypothetical protein